MDGERTYMKFEKVVIKNFRNFDNVELDLSNKNIFFGLNDVGKTNFLYALRYVFDKDIRKQNLLDSDFHNKQLDKPIEIVVTIDISDVADSDCQKLRAQLKGALLSEHNKVYIKLFAEYSKTEMLALPILSWGGDINHLYEMKQRGYLYEIDYVFNVIYIDSYAKLRRSSIEMEAITLDNIYKLMLNFGKLYDIISDEEKKSLITYLIKEVQIYPNGESEMPLKSIEFNFPIYRDGQEVRRLLWEKGNIVETVVLMSQVQ